MDALTTPDSPAAIEATICRREDSRYEAMCKKDLAVLDGLLASGFRYTHLNGVVDDREGFLRRVSDLCDYRDLSRTEVAFQHGPRGTTMTGRIKMTVTRTADGTVINGDNRFAAVWVKQGYDWRMRSWISSPL